MAHNIATIANGATADSRRPSSAESAPERRAEAPERGAEFGGAPSESLPAPQSGPLFIERNNDDLKFGQVRRKCFLDDLAEARGAELGA